MEGLMTFTGLIIIVFGILQIILFFKIWGMTNNTKRIWNKMNENGLIEKACASYIKGNIDEIEKLLHEAFLLELAQLSAANLNDFEEWNSTLSKIIEKYAIAFKKIDRPAPDFDKYKNPKIYLL